MAQDLEHSPADIIRRVLIAVGAGTLPPATVWPIYALDEPPTPDDVMTVYDTGSIMQGRDMFDGTQTEHYGVQVRIRASNPRNGYNRAVLVAKKMDLDVYQTQITIDGINYYVHSINRSGGVITMGKERQDDKEKGTPKSKRSLFSVNGTAYIEQQ